MQTLPPTSLTIQQLIARLGVREPISLERAARELALTPRTLQRRLSAEGTTYRAVVDSVRITHAIDLLLYAGQSIPQVAIDVGFSEPAAFRRAFKRWTGVAASQFRVRRDPRPNILLERSESMALLLRR